MMRLIIVENPTLEVIDHLVYGRNADTVSTVLSTAAPEESTLDESAESTEDERYIATETTEEPAEVDVDGVAWNEALHTRTRSKTAEGRWKLKRGVEAPPAVEAQAPAAPVVPPPPVYTGPGVVGDAYQSFLSRMGQSIAAGEKTGSDVTAALQAVGLNNMPELFQNQHLVSAVEAILWNS